MKSKKLTRVISNFISVSIYIIMGYVFAYKNLPLWIPLLINLLTTVTLNVIFEFAKEQAKKELRTVKTVYRADNSKIDVEEEI